MPDTSTLRATVLNDLARRIASVLPEHTIRVAIDGVDGAGKTVFADELGDRLGRFRPVIRASVDSFHNPRDVRYRQGRASPIGYYRDSYDYGRLSEALLEPLRPGGIGRYRRAVFNHALDAPVDEPVEVADAGAVLVLDGIFLHRPELADAWEYSIFLTVPFEISVARCAARDGTSPDPADPSNKRYVEGQRFYLAESSPQERASAVIDNSDFDAPRIR